MASLGYNELKKRDIQDVAEIWDLKYAWEMHLQTFQEQWTNIQNLVS